MFETAKQNNLFRLLAIFICSGALMSCRSVQEDAPVTVYANGNYEPLARCYAEKYDSGEFKSFLSVEIVPHDSERMIRLKASTSEGWRKEIFAVDLMQYSDNITRIDARGTVTFGTPWSLQALTYAQNCGLTRGSP